VISWFALSDHTDTTRFLRWKLKTLTKTSPPGGSITNMIADNTSYNVTNNLFTIEDIPTAPAPDGQKFYVVTQLQTVKNPSVTTHEFVTTALAVLPRAATITTNLLKLSEVTNTTNVAFLIHDV
jgi:hypothetical protein